MTTETLSAADSAAVDLSALEPVRIGPTWQRDEQGRWLLPKWSLGWHILAWTSENLQHSNGDDWRYTLEQARLTLWWYAVDENGEFIYRDGVIQRLKGWGKDPLAATWCAVEFIGPCRPSGEYAKFDVPDWVDPYQPVGRPHPEAWVQIAAVSKDQTRNTMTLFPGLFKKSTIEEHHIDLGKEIIYANRGRQRIEAVTSSPRALEGARATFVVRNETHHWLSNNEGHEMEAVISRNADKSTDGSARAISITNAFEPGEDSVAERARDAYEEVLAGRAVDTGMLYDSLEAPPEAPLTAEAAPKVIEMVRGDSTWLSVPRIVKSILDTRNPPSRSRRFWYNQIVAAEDAWITPQQWDALERKDRLLEDGESICVFFDGSKSDDATVLVGSCVSDGHVFLIGCWQRPIGLDPKLPWSVPRHEVDAAVERMFDTWDVVGFFADPGGGHDESGERYWDAHIDRWANLYGDRLLVKATSTKGRQHAVMWDMGSPARQQEFTEATERCYSDIVSTRTLTHDGNRILRQHAVNARRRPNKWGVAIGKEHRESAKKIDAIVAAIGARMVRRLVLSSPSWTGRSSARRKRSGRVYGFS